MMHYRHDASALPAQHVRPIQNFMSSNDPLHGVTLEAILTRLVADYGWPELGRRIRIRCFNFDPSISSSLKFLRRTPWARLEVEKLYRLHVGNREN
jgi:uncharacterized protein (DUF2132 family)